MAKTFNELAKPRVQKLKPYLSARRIGGQGHTFLNANEAPSSASFLMSSQSLNRYPECQPPELFEAYADYAGVKPEQVMVSRGSDEAIGLLIRTFCEEEKDSILICPPTYGMYSVSAETNGAKIVTVPPRDDFSTDSEAVVNALNNDNSIKLVFLCSPNNPTGNTLSDNDLLPILKATNGRALVVVDEAYIEFCSNETKIKLLSEYTNLVITRTLSKAFGLAGIRCGFTLANSEIIKLLLKVIDPYPVCDPVAQIAIQALSKNGLQIMQDRVKEINERKERFVSEVKKLPYVEEVFDTKPNYVLFRFHDGEALFSECVRHGIILRDFNDKTRLKNCVRITIGSEQEMQEVLTVLNSIKQ